MASGGYRRRKTPVSRFVSEDHSSRFSPSPLTAGTGNPWPTSAHYFAREAPRRYYDERENDVSANDAYNGGDDTDETMTLSQRVLSRQRSNADGDDRYDDLDVRYNRLVIDEENELDGSSIYDDDDDNDNDIDIDDEDKIPEEDGVDDDTGVVKVEKYPTAFTATAINSRSNNNNCDSSEGNEHLQPDDVTDRYELS